MMRRSYAAMDTILKELFQLVAVHLTVAVKRFHASLKLGQKAETGELPLAASPFLEILTLQNYFFIPSISARIGMKP